MASAHEGELDQQKMNHDYIEDGNLSNTNCIVFIIVKQIQPFGPPRRTGIGSSLVCRFVAQT